MVSSEDQVLDEIILQVFEEQDEAFHFPVTSQKDARAFVRALHKKGLSYDCLSHEIQELEQNFSAWRTGISRPGIGNRVIERINRPLQDVLLSDEEDDSACCDQLSTCSNDTMEESGETNHNGVDSFRGKDDHLTAESKLADDKKVAQKPDNKGVDKKDDKLGDSRTQIEKTINGNRASSEKIDKLAVEQGQGDLREDVKDNCQTKESSKVAASDVDAVKKNADVVSQPSELALSGSDISMTKVSETKNNHDLKPVKAKKPDIENVAKKTRNSEITTEQEELKERSESLHHDTKVADCDAKHVSADSFNDNHHKNVVSQDKISSEDTVLQEKASRIETESSDVKVIAEDVELLEAQRTDSEFIGHTTDQENKVEEIVEEKVEIVEETQYLQLSKDVSNKNSSEVAMVKDTKTLSTADEQKNLDRSQISDSTGPSVPTGDAGVKADAMKPVPILCSLAGEATSVSSHKSSDVLENYSSDVDDEFIDDDFTGVTEKENEMGKETIPKLSSREFGYIYVFTDSSSEVDQFRVKIGASRFPHKKLKQALLFNIDMKLVSAVKVSHRQKAVDAVYQQLNEYAVPNTIGWFLGPLDKILNVLMAATKDYPVLD